MKKLLLPTMLLIQIFACSVFANCAHLKQLIGSWKFDTHFNKNHVSYFMNIDNSGKVTGYAIRIKPGSGFTESAYTISGEYGMTYGADGGACTLQFSVTGKKYSMEDDRFTLHDNTLRFTNANIAYIYGFAVYDLNDYIKPVFGYKHVTLTLIKY